ncbi:MAG: protein kinase [Actinomycetaceae bacterium]|nr:protein kinase [Actinomycetaceae bacterium]
MTKEEQIGGYRLVRRLGTGGAGTVWLASDDLGSFVAIKLLHPILASTPAARERLMREARTVNSVKGAAVARVVDIEVDTDQPFVVSEYVDGPNLSRVIAQGPLGGETLAALTRSLYMTMQAVHDAKVVHRDVKPSNIICAAQGPILIDFGIAMSEGDSQLTSTGLVSGTAGYAAPELLRGEHANPGTDWWALAATLLSAATGRPPYGKGATSSILMNVIEGKADLSGLSPHLAQVLGAALDPLPECRPSPQEVVEGIELACGFAPGTAQWRGIPHTPAATPAPAPAGAAGPQMPPVVPPGTPQEGRPALDNYGEERTHLRGHPISGEQQQMGASAPHGTPAVAHGAAAPVANEPPMDTARRVVSSHPQDGAGTSAEDGAQKVSHTDGSRPTPDATNVLPRRRSGDLPTTAKTTHLDQPPAAPTSPLPHGDESAPGAQYPSAGNNPTAPPAALGGGHGVGPGGQPSGQPYVSPQYQGPQPGHGGNPAGPQNAHPQTYQGPPQGPYPPGGPYPGHNYPPQQQPQAYYLGPGGNGAHHANGAHGAGVPASGGPYMGAPQPPHNGPHGPYQPGSHPAPQRPDQGQQQGPPQNAQTGQAPAAIQWPSGQAPTSSPNRSNSPGGNSGQVPTVSSQGAGRSWQVATPPSRPVSLVRPSGSPAATGQSNDPYLIPTAASRYANAQYPPQFAPVNWLVATSLMGPLAAVPVLTGQSGTLAVMGILMLLGTVGAAQRWREMRRYRAGGVRSSDTVAAAAMSPVLVLRTFAATLLGVVVGVIAAAIAWALYYFIALRAIEGASPLSDSFSTIPPWGWPWELVTSNLRSLGLEDLYVQDLHWCIVATALAWIVLLVNLATPTSTDLRSGLGVLTELVAPTWWMRLLVAGLSLVVVLATWMVVTLP